MNTFPSVNRGPSDESDAIISPTSKHNMGWKIWIARSPQKKNVFGVATSRELSSTETAAAVPRQHENHLLSYC